METKVTIFKNILNTTEPDVISIKTIIERIKNGKNATLITKIRTEKDKKKRNELKQQLPSICFSGIFKKRANNGIISHSGLVCIDFDHVKDLYGLKRQLSLDKYTFLCFISPSGDGIKLVVKIPANVETHSASCKAIKEYFNKEELDNFEDVARVCFESLDSEIFVNENSEVFTDLYTEKIETKKIEIIESETDDYIIFSNLKKWIEEQEHYIDGNKHTFLVKFAGALNRFGVSNHLATNFLKTTYQTAASFVKSDDFEKIVNKVYSNYANQFNISTFDKKTLKSYERKTSTYTATDFFKEYDEEKIKELRFKQFFEKTYIDLSKPPIKKPTILSIKKDKFEFKYVSIFTLGNISAIHGKAKSKKTFLNSIFASVLTSNSEYANLIKSELPEHKNQIVYLDTEQSKYDSYNVNRRIVKMAGDNANNFSMFSLRGTNAFEKLEFLEYLIKTVSQVGVVFIDQIADLAKSINDEEEAVRVVNKLEELTNNYDIHIACVIHQNKANDNATGWLGSQIMKKAETIIKVTKDKSNKNISIVDADATRGEDFEPFAFQINEYGFPEIISDYNISEDRY